MKTIDSKILCALVTCLWLACYFAVAAGMPKESKEEKKYCPLEFKGNKCKSRRHQFKCGAFFINLHGQTEKLRWIGALPDILAKPSVRKSPALMKSMGNVNKKSFRFERGECDISTVNSECLDLMAELSTLTLESCDVNMLNEHGKKTLGNVLCEKAGLWSPGQHFQSFVKIGFYHSACGSDWTQTRLDGQPLGISEELCCKFVNGRGSFFRCDGSSYKGTCNGEELPIERDETKKLTEVIISKKN